MALRRNQPAVARQPLGPGHTVAQQRPRFVVRELRSFSRRKPAGTPVSRHPFG